MADPSTEERVNLRGPDGSFANVPISKAKAALDAGYTIASEEDVAAEKERQFRQTAPEQVKTGAEGLVRGATLGFGEPLLTGISSPEDVAARKAANPELALGTELGGAILPLLATGGTGAVATGVRAAGAAPRAVAAVGGAVERVAASALGRSVAARTAGTAAAGAFEGAVVGAGQAVSEAALTDTELTGEMVAAGMGHGALLGGAAGGALGLGVAGVGKALGGAKAAVGGAAARARAVLPEGALGGKPAAAVGDAVEGGAAARATGDALEGTPAAAVGDAAEGALGGSKPGMTIGEAAEAGLSPQAARKTVPDAAEAVEGGTEDMLQQFNRRSKAAEAEDEILEEHIHGISANLKERAELSDALHNKLNMGDKYKAQATAIKEDVASGAMQRTSVEVAEQADDMISGVMREVDEIAGKRKTREGIEKLQKKIKELRADGAAIKGTSKKSAAARSRNQARIDKLQRKIDDTPQPDEVFQGQAFENREANAARRLKSEFLDEKAKIIRDLRDRARNGEEVRGELMQHLDQTKRAVGRISKSLGGRGTAGTGDVVFTAGGIMRRNYDDIAMALENPSAFGARAADIQSADNAVWTKYFDSDAGFNETLLMKGEGHGGKRVQTGDTAGWTQSDLGDEGKIDTLIRGAGRAKMAGKERMMREGAEAETALLEQLANSRSLTIDNETVAQVARFRELNDELVGRFDNAKATSQSAREHADWLKKWQGVPLAETVTRTVSTLAEKARMLAGMEAQAATVSSKIDKAVKAAVSSTKAAATKAGRTAKTVARAGAAKAPRAERFDDAAERVTRQAAAPMVIGEQVAARVGDHKVASAVVGTVVRGNAFLKSKMPAPMIRDSERQPHIKGPQRVSNSEMSRWLRYVEAVEDPMSVVAALEAGTLRREGAEALRVVHPRMYAELKSRVNEQVADESERMSRKKLTQLSILFDEPYHFSMEPGFLLSMQQNAEAEQQEAEQGGGFVAPSARKPPDTSGDHMTETQRISQ